MINKSITQLISMTRLENLQWAKEMTIQQDADYNSFIIVSLNNYQLLLILVSKNHLTLIQWIFNELNLKENLQKKTHISTIAEKYTEFRILKFQNFIKEQKNICKHNV